VKFEKRGKNLTIRMGTADYKRAEPERQGGRKISREKKRKGYTKGANWRTKKGGTKCRDSKKKKTQGAECSLKGGGCEKKRRGEKDKIEKWSLKAKTEKGK